MVWFITAKINAMLLIASGTCFICFQDFTKKGIVFKNFKQSLKDGKNQSELTAYQRIKQKYQHSKSIMKQVKNQGNGSFYQGLKKMYKEYNQAQNQGLNPQKRQIIKGKVQQMKQIANKIKQQGNGKFSVGLKKMYQQSKKSKVPSSQTKINTPSIEQSESKQTNQITKSQVNPNTQKNPSYINNVYQKLLATKDAMLKKYKQTNQLYQKASATKSQKLIKKHLQFAAMAIFGSIILPRAYLILSLAYFTAYQIYYFSEIINKDKKYQFLQNIQFTPIWKGFMFGGVVLFGGQAIKLIKNLS